MYGVYSFNMFRLIKLPHCCTFLCADHPIDTCLKRKQEFNNLRKTLSMGSKSPQSSPMNSNTGRSRTNQSTRSSGGRSASSRTPPHTSSTANRTVGSKKGGRERVTSNSEVRGDSRSPPIEDKSELDDTGIQMNVEMKEEKEKEKEKEKETKAPLTPVQSGVVAGDGIEIVTLDTPVKHASNSTEEEEEESEEKVSPLPTAESDEDEVGIEIILALDEREEEESTKL